MSGEDRPDRRREDENGGLSGIEADLILLLRRVRSGRFATLIVEILEADLELFDGVGAADGLLGVNTRCSLMFPGTEFRISDI